MLPPFRVALICLFLFVMPLLLHADPLEIVTKTADTDDGVCDADCSFREAVNLVDNGGAILFEPALAGATIVLGSTIDLKDTVTITAPLEGITISGNNAVRVFLVIAGGEEVTLNNLIITGGGGGSGGGFQVQAGTLILNNCAVVHNNPGGTGGGLTISIVGTATLHNSIVAFNNSAIGGGGISNGGSLNLYNSTVAHNTVLGNDPAHLGGGIDHFGGAAKIRNSTIAYNSVPGGGGGGISFSGGSVALTSTLIANNSATTGPDLLSFSTFGGGGNTYDSNGFNLVGINAGFNINAQGTDQIGVAAPGLDPAGALDNGNADAVGLTQTVALQAGSPAIDMGSCTNADFPDHDQRFFGQSLAGPRAVDDGGIPNADDGCDVGAFEANATPLGTTVNLRAFLDGPYNTGTNQMDTALNSGGHLPAVQPYGDPAYDGTPLDYDGTEQNLALPGTAVDWVLIQVRTGQEAASTARTRAGLLHADGSITGPSGVGPVPMPVLEEDYYVVVRHRNSLAIMTPTQLNLEAVSSLHDFTFAPTQAFGVNPLREQEPGAWALWGGDGDLNQGITANDFLTVWLPDNGSAPGYKLSDFDLNANVTAFDFLTVWLPANGLASQVP